MKRVLKRRKTRRQTKKQTGKRKKNNKSLSKRKVKRRTRTISRSKRQTKLRQKKFNSRIKSIFTRSLKKKQRGGHTPKNEPSFLSAKGRGSMTNTLDNINSAGGQFATDSYLQAENSIGNLYNNLVGQSETMSPSVTSQPLSH